MNKFEKISPAILMCTCRAYTEIAQATCNLLDLFWQDHPDIFVVGGKDITGGQSIPFSCHEKDWVGMAYEAVQWLQSNSFTHCYLILDDHPPVGFCNWEFLNRTLPELCGQLNATHVALAGWDQFQPKDGVAIIVGKQQWMLNSLSYKWKFDLHPGYWNLAGLEIILKKIIDISPRIYSAREFEGISGSGKLALPSNFLKATYKIAGDCNASGKHWYQRQLTRRLILYFLHLLRLTTAKIIGRDFLSRLDRHIEVYTQYINGPYPMYWSGVIKKGKLNSNLVKFVKITKNKPLIKWLGSFYWPV